MPRSPTGLAEGGWRLDCSRVGVSTSVLSSTSSFTLWDSVTSRTDLTVMSMWTCTGTTSRLGGRASSSFSPGLTHLHPSTLCVTRPTNLLVITIIISFSSCYNPMKVRTTPTAGVAGMSTHAENLTTSPPSCTTALNRKNKLPGRHLLSIFVQVCH